MATRVAMAMEVQRGEKSWEQVFCPGGRESGRNDGSALG